MKNSSPAETDPPPPLKGEGVGGHGEAAAEAGAAIENLVAAFRLLAPRDQKRALALMSLEAQRRPAGDDRDLDLWSSAVHEALVRTLGPSDGAAYGPQVVRRLLAFPVVWGPVEEFLALLKVADMAPAERMAVFRLLASLLVRRARQVAAHADIPMSAKLVSQNAQHLPAIFDAAFPGYIAAGLAGVVARRATRARVGGEQQPD